MSKASRKRSLSWHCIILNCCLFCLLLLLAACRPATEPGEEVASNVQVFVVPAGSEKRLISDEKIDQDNCNGTAQTSQTIQRSHAVLYSLELGTGLTVSAEGNVGIPNIGQVGVGAEVATHYKVGYGRTETLTRSVTVAAKEGSYIQHTVQQFEVWETGEVLIVAEDKNFRTPYSFRRDFSIDAVAPANIGCPTSQEQVVTATALPTPESDEDSISATVTPATDEPSLPPVGEIPEFEVIATTPQNPTNLEVKQGDLIHFEYLHGQWTGEKVNAGLSSGCKGSFIDPFAEHVWPLAPEEHGDALIGYIGGTPFLIGCTPITIEAFTSGALALGMNDCQNCYWDNEGSLYVHISIERR